MGSSFKRRRSLASERESVASLLKETCTSQQSTLASIRKEVLNLKFIVEHLIKDAQCILNVNTSNLKEKIDSQMALVNFISSETGILQKAELEAKCQTLELTLYNLQSEHKLLIEQQVSSEEAMLDELARLMSENEKLKNTSTNSCSSEIHDLYEIVHEIEQEIAPKLNLELFLANMRATNVELQSELKLKAETIACNERSICTLQEKLSQVEEEMSHEKSSTNLLITELKSQVEALQVKLEEEERKFTNIQDGLCTKDAQLDATLSQLESTKTENSSLTIQIDELKNQITVKERQIEKFESDLLLSRDESSKLASELEQLKHVLELNHQKLEGQSEHLKQLESLKIRFSSLEEAHSCLLDIVKDKDANLTDLQSKVESLTKEHEENELRVRELISINAELLDSVEASKRMENVTVNKETQIVALQQALSESQKLSELRELELERIRQEKAAMNLQMSDLSENFMQFETIQKENQSLAIELSSLKEANETLQQRLAVVDELKTSSKSEVILKIEIEKLKETLSRERKLNDLKIIDLEKQIEGLRDELTRVKLAEDRRLSVMPGKDNDTENLDPFKEAKDKLALLSNTTEVSESKRVLQAPGAPPQECLQQ